MNYLLFLPVFLLSFQTAFAVHECYFCNDCAKNAPVVNNCEKVVLNATHWLCESREDTTTGVINKRCMENSVANIAACDLLNTNKNTSCYNCDRELCNTSSKISGSVVLALVPVFMLLKYV